jgi:hypothetical protein
VSDLQRVAVFWREAVEREQALVSEVRLRARRRLHASVSLLGMVRVDGDLDPGTGESVLTALRAVLDAEARSGAADDRTPNAGRCARRDLPSVARPGRAAGRGRRTSTRHGDGGCGYARIPPRSRGAGSRRTRRYRCCEGARLRCVRHAGRDVRACRAARRRSSDTGRPTLDAPGRDRSRSPVPVPRLPPSAYLVRRSSRGALGRRRADRVGEPVVALPPPPPHGALGTLPPGALGRPSRVPETRWLGHGGESASIAPALPRASRRRWTLVYHSVDRA